MKNISKTPAVLISLALTLTSVPLPVFSAVAVQTQVSQSAVPGGITGLPVNAASQNLGNGSLLTPAARLNLSGTLALPQTPIVAAPGAQAVVTFAAPESAAPVTPVVAVPVAAPGGQGPAVLSGQTFSAPGEGQTQLAALSAEASVETTAAPAQRKSLIGRLASAIAAKLNFGRVFDNSKSAAPAALAGILPQKSNLPQGMVLDEAPSVPDTSKGRGVSIENFDLPGVLATGADIFSAGPTVLQADPTNEAAVESALRAMVDADPVKYGIPSSQLATIHVRRVAGVGHQADTIYAYFQQQQGGIVMHGTALSFTVKVIQGKPVVMASMAKLFPKTSVDTSQRFPDEELKDKALERLGPYTQMYGLEATFLEKKVVYVKGAWHAANIYLIENGPGPIMLAVDVVSGEAFAWDPRSGAETQKGPATAGAVSGKTVDRGPILPNAELKEIALGYLSVQLGGKTYVTDRDGRFTTETPLEVGPEGLNLTATLSGPYTRLQDSSGKTLSVNVTVKPGDGDLKVVFNPNSTLNDENALAQISGFQKVNLAYDFLKSRKLTNDKMDSKPIIVRTNIDDECNAYYTPGRPSLNFFKSSENCVNTSYDTVADHEYGHYWDDMLGGIVNGGISEGWGDILSMYLLNNPIIGEHFLRVPRDGVDYIRHGDNTYQYGEYDEVHDQGQAWGGFSWKLRKALMAKMGDAAGAALAEILVMPTMFAKASNIPAAMAQVLLADMDANGNLPHEADIRAAAQAHGITLPQNPGKIAMLTRRLTNWVLSLIS